MGRYTPFPEAKEGDPNEADSPHRADRLIWRVGQTSPVFCDLECSSLSLNVCRPLDTSPSSSCQVISAKLTVRFKLMHGLLQNLHIYTPDEFAYSYPLTFQRWLPHTLPRGTVIVEQYFPVTHVKEPMTAP